MNPKRLSAFTLVELLVVISIIALLIAMLLPSLQAARTAAKVTKGTSQVRQIQVALMMYSDTNDGFLPYSSTGPEADNKPLWNELLVSGEFMTDQENFYSPNHDRSVTHRGNLKYSGFGTNSWGTMPTLNTSSGNPVGKLPYCYGRVQFPNPSDMVNVGDSAWTLSPGYNDGSFILTRELFTYNGRYIRSYVDGHAKSDSAENVYWLATSDRTGRFDRVWNGIDNGNSDEVRRYWQGPWYPRTIGSAATNATY